MVKFTKEQDELLIESVKLNSILFDASVKDYKNNVLKHKRWEEMSLVVGLPVLTIINIEQIEVRALNKTDNLENPVNKRSEKASKTERNDRVLIKKTYTDYDQRSDINLDSKCDILTRNKHNLKNNDINDEETDSNKSQEKDENIASNIKITSTTELTSLYNRKQFSNEKKLSEHADYIYLNNRILVTVGQKTVIEKIKQESATELDTNDESSLQDNVGKKNRLTVQRRKRLTVRHHTTKVSKPEAITDKLLIPKTTQTWGNEVNNDIICKSKHSDYNHSSFEKISRENDKHRLKRRDETKTVSKRANKLKHRYSKSNRAFKGTTLLENMSKSEYSDLSDTLSKENEMYKQEQVDKSVEVPVSQVKPKRKPELAHNYQTKNKVTKKVTDKAKHKSKTKHRFDKVKPNKVKKKPMHNDKTKSHTDSRSGDSGSINSEDTLNLNEADTQTHKNQVMKELQDSSEELFNENHFLNKPILPFYVSSTTPTMKYTNEIAKNHPIKQDLQKDEKNYTEILLNDLNSILNEKSDLTNQKIDINKIINRLASSKIFNFITERVAGHMLEKLQNSQTFQNNFRTKNVKPEKVEHIDILFKRDGDMVMMNRENLLEKEHEFGMK